MILLAITSGVHTAMEISHETDHNYCCYKTCNSDLCLCIYQRCNLVDSNSHLRESLLQ